MRGNDFIFITASFPSDGHGLVSSDAFGDPGTVHMDLTQPQYAFAIEHTDFVTIEFYQGSQLLYSSAMFAADFTPFVGFISTEPFDRVIALDLTGSVLTIDNIYFNGAIPAPGTLVVTGMATLIGLRRRRRN